MTKCMVMGCEQEAWARGMCSSHHRAWQRKTPPDQRPDVTKPPRRHAELVGLFGGVRPFCRAVGIDANTLYRWPEGEIPHERWADIADGATRAGVDAEAVRAALVR